MVAVISAHNVISMWSKFIDVTYSRKYTNGTTKISRTSHNHISQSVTYYNRILEGILALHEQCMNLHRWNTKSIVFNLEETCLIKPFAIIELFFVEKHSWM